MDSFQKRKKDVLSKLDKSSKKSWDVKIVSLCEKINSLENFYTTSSCSGRIVLIVDNSKKVPGLFVKVWHEKINFEDLKDSLEDVHLKVYPLICRMEQAGAKKNIIFKQEPVILHVACKSLEESLDFLKKARLVGFKRGGIISGGRRFMIELIGTEKIEFPIISDGAPKGVQPHTLKGTSDEFLKLIVKKSNENLERGWKKIEKLKNIL